jgi:hypothetical protein
MLILQHRPAEKQIICSAYKIAQPELGYFFGTRLSEPVAGRGYKLL